MGEHHRRGHQLGRLVARVTEHQALVAGALLGGLLALDFLGIDALRNIGGLSGEVVVDENGVGVKHVVVVGVADVADRVADDFAEVDRLFKRLSLTRFLVLELRDRDLAADDDDV